MKRRKALSLLLSLAIVLSLVFPVATAFAADGDTNEGENKTSGLSIHKTAEYDAQNDAYTITLEAYATGEKTTTVISKDVPTDIILLLDQSGSMSKTFSTATEDSWLSYGKQQNSTNYNLRMNNNDWFAEKNLYYKLPDGAYVEVSVDRTRETVQKYVNYSDARNSSCYSNRTNLYANTEEGYKKITLTRTNRNGTYTYTYTLNDGTEVKRESTRQNGVPPYEIYQIQNSYEYTYEYYYTLNRVKTVIGTKSKGADTIFDEELYQYVPSGTSITRQEALLSTVRGFLNSVSEKAKGADGAYGTDDDVNHRIAVVKFTDNATDLTNGLVDMDSADGLTTVVRAVNSLSTGGDTKPSTALDTANNIFKDNPVESGKRNRVVILFTDGYPAESNTDCINYTWCDNAIESAYTSKKTYGATVYTVGIYDGANPDSDINTNFEYGNRYESTLNTKQLVAANRYMHYTSSNYPNAESLQNGGERAGSGYYLSAADMDSLNSIFQQISDNVSTGGTSVTLEESAVIRDIVAQAFTMPENASDVKVYTAASKGSVNDWDTPELLPEKTSDGRDTITIDKENRTVSVTGFNYKENWCGNETINGEQSFHNGKKLILEFTVKPKAGFLGGNDVYTNDGAGIYEKSTDEKPLLEFNKPTVNVPIKDVTVAAPDKNVYLLGSVTLGEIQNGATAKVGDVTLQLDQTNYGLQDWQTEYVEIIVEYKNGSETLTDLADLKDDVEYTVTVTVNPKTTGTTTDEKGPAAESKSSSATGRVNVFKPELTFVDSVGYYGEKLSEPLYVDNMSGMAWKHGTTSSKDDGVVMTGEEPDLGLTYTAGAGIKDGVIDTKQDIPVKVDVTINEESVIEHTTFKHECGMDGCTWTQPTAKGDPAFLIHVKTCTLTITKTGGAANESYVFVVKKGGQPYSEVSIWGNSSETIVELPVGTYTIEENTGWSWRYPTYSSNDVELSASNTSGTITCTNNRGNNNKWLNGFSEIVRNILGQASTPATDTTGNN